jgi:hypothetical protein
VARAHQHGGNAEHATAAAEVHHDAPLDVAQAVRSVQDARCEVRAGGVLLQLDLRRRERLHVFQERLQLLQLHGGQRAAGKHDTPVHAQSE